MIFDYSINNKKNTSGKLNPISYYIGKIKKIFYSMGFKYVTGPEIESIKNNFDKLNIGKSHLSREKEQSIYLKNFYNKYENVKYLMRTHTSGVQIRHLSKYNPPIKVFSIGKVYRPDQDSTHNPMFHQVECINIDKKSNIINMKKIICKFIYLFFNKKKIYFRLRSSYFPFTEPSFEMDIQEKNLHSKNLKIIECLNWIEILGCGLINEKVMKNVNLNKKIGFAIGIGLERIIMLKENINDIRKLYCNNIIWLNKYGY